MDKIEKIKNFAFTSDKMKKYSFVFQINSNSELNVSAVEEISKKKFSSNFSLNYLKNNRYLSLLDTIEEMFDEIINRITLKNPLLYEEKDCLKIVIETSHFKFKDITLCIGDQEKNINERLNELYDIVWKLQEREQIKDEKIKNLEERIIESEKNIKTNYVNDIIYNIQSIILKNNNNYFMRIKNWINPNKEINFKLLYRMTRDGDSIRTFHNLCDNQGPTISLYLLNDGNIIGGYTPLNWDILNEWKNDNETFVFNINKNLKCVEKNDNTNSIFCHVSYSGFYGTLGYYEGSSDSMKNLFYYNSDSIFRNGNKILDLNQNTKIEPIEVEIFSVY